MVRILRYSLVAILLLPALAEAQSDGGKPSIFATLAVTSQWDDETHLGVGPLVGIGITATPLSALRVEGEVTLARHHRDSGYLEATGTPLVVAGRAAWLIGSASWSARPFVSGAVTLTHSRGELRFSSAVPGPDGFPVPGPTEIVPWRVTRPGWELGLGVEAGRRGRVTFRPEIRVSTTWGTNNYRPGTDPLEIPIVTMRGGLGVIF